MRSLRFCMVTTFYPPFSFGGDAMCVYRLATALGERGHAVDVFHSEDAYRLQHPADPETSFDEHPNVTRRPVKTKLRMANALRAYQTGNPSVYSDQLEDLLSEGKYDVIHYHNVSLMGGPGILRVGRAAKLYTAHEYWLLCPTHVLFAFNREACTEKRCLRCTINARRPPQAWRYTRLLERCTPHVDRFIMPSRFALERHKAAGIEGQMTVLPNFVPLAGPSSEQARVSDRPFFVFVGRLEKLKGLQDIIPLFRDYAEADLLIVGDGDYRSELESLADGLANVKFIGHVHPSKIGSYYSQAIAVLMPSLCYEVFPLIPAEALMHGTPVIGRRIGAIEEVLEESGGGLTFSDAAECKAAMDKLRTDDQLRRTMSERGRKIAESRWTTEPHLERYEELVNEVLAAKSQITYSTSSAARPGPIR